MSVTGVLGGVSVLPWFRRWPRFGGTVAAGLYGAILAWRVADGGGIDEAAVLLCLPVSLVAVTYGLRGGLAAGVAGATPIAAWSDLDLVAWSELGAVLLLGGLLGHAIDNWCAAEAENRRLADAASRYREAVELNDTVVQGLAAAKWALEAGHLERGLHIVADTLETAQQLVSELLRDVAPAPRTTATSPPGSARIATAGARTRNGAE